MSGFIPTTAGPVEQLNTIQNAFAELVMQSKEDLKGFFEVRGQK